MTNSTNHILSKLGSTPCVENKTLCDDAIEKPLPNLAFDVLVSMQPKKSNLLDLLTRCFPGKGNFDVTPKS
jgi:hypothetical protein